MKSQSVLMNGLFLLKWAFFGVSLGLLVAYAPLGFAETPSMKAIRSNYPQAFSLPGAVLNAEINMNQHYSRQLNQSLLDRLSGHQETQDDTPLIRFEPSTNRPGSFLLDKSIQP